MSAGDYTPAGERDMENRIAGARGHEVRVRDVMTAELVTVDPETTLRELLGVLTSNRIRGVPVVSGSAVVGVVSGTDVLEFEAAMPAASASAADAPEDDYDDFDGVTAEWRDGESGPASFFMDTWGDDGPDLVERFREERGPDWDPLAEHDVSEVMTRTLCTTGSDATLREAAQRMMEAGVHRLLVMRDSRLLGIVSAADVLRAVASHGVRRGDSGRGV
jgi:CBS domain-containing protein